MNQILVKPILTKTGGSGISSMQEPKEGHMGRYKITVLKSTLVTNSALSLWF